MSDPKTISLRYVGAIREVTLAFASTGRSFRVARGEVLDLLPNEADALAGRPDFEDPEGPPPGPTEGPGIAGAPANPDHAPLTDEENPS